MHRGSHDALLARLLAPSPRRGMPPLLRPRVPTPNTLAPVGIVGGNSGEGGIITITGGTVTATCNGSGAGIGRGESGGNDGTFSTTGGNAFIVTHSISDNGEEKKGQWSGVIFEGDSGNVYGSPTLKEDATIPSGKTLTIENGKTLTIDSGVTLTNNGTITNNGTLTNNGTINGDGSYSGSGTVNKTKQTAPGTGEGYTISYTNKQSQ